MHKQSLAAVAVDEAGRMLAETTVAAANNDLLEWACRLRGLSKNGVRWPLGSQLRQTL